MVTASNETTFLLCSSVLFKAFMYLLLAYLVAVKPYFYVVLEMTAFSCLSQNPFFP